MTSRFSAIAVLALTAGLGACSSPAPIHYYTLLPPTAVPPAAASAAVTQPASSFLIDVLPVGLPEYLDQQPLVVRQSSGGGAVSVLDEERWVGPLGDELRNALSVQLAERLGTQDVSGLASSADQKVLRIKVQIRRMDAWLGNQVQLEAGWSLGLAQGSKARLVCQGRFTEPTQDGYPALVQAQQRAVGALAARIAMDARAWGASQQAKCSAE